MGTIIDYEYRHTDRLRASPNNRVVTRPSEKVEAKAAGQKCSEAWLLHVENVFGRQRRHSGFAAGRNRAGYLDTLSNMQNKPNLLSAEMNITSALTKDYKNISPTKKCENKPNQTQFQYQICKTNPNRTQFQPKNEADKPKQSQFPKW